MMAIYHNFIFRKSDYNRFFVDNYRYFFIEVAYNRQKSDYPDILKKRLWSVTIALILFCINYNRWWSTIVDYKLLLTIILIFSTKINDYYRFFIAFPENRLFPKFSNFLSLFSIDYYRLLSIIITHFFHRLKSTNCR